MKKLIILDYVVPTVHIYDLYPDVDIDESYIKNLGINTNCASWMFGEDIEIIHHRKVLK